ncbi:MAG TPA: hypothetical protein VMF51_18350 [Nocardioides sp.]|uniref:hypothetical protein n=1 Tax=Nocardioides sp. TaxID=35761 RepID=UPI002CB79BE3|nr:hypothetical protein [Nocardioides sp.]HTW17098.1 hypothetical protein [Nocardioides sp.]
MILLTVEVYAVHLLALFAPAAADSQPVDVVTDAQMWALIVGFASPLLIAVVQQPTWSGRRRTLVTIVWSIVAGGGTAFFTDEFTGRSLLSCFLVICVAAIATYQSIWRPLKIAPAIEAATSRRAFVKTVAGEGGTEKVVVERT